MAKWKEVLILVVGMTPQIITETVYALAMAKLPITVDEVWVVTTALGKRRVEDTLLAKGILRDLTTEYGMPDLHLGPSSFVLVTDKKGVVLEDIVTKDDNETMGDLITTFIREKAADDRSRLHCSIAGGRKTMSFYLGAALQLFGRPQDKLYHVLVTPEFESNPSFFYKPKRNRTVETRLPDGTTKRLDTRDAVISLAELPFIRLGDKISHEGKTFRELVEAGQRGIDTAFVQPPLRINLRDRVLSVGNRQIELIPVQLIVYALFARRKVDRCLRPERVYCADCRDCFQALTDFGQGTILEEMARDYEAVYGGSRLKAGEFLARWKKGFPPDLVRQNISKINRAVREQLGDENLAAFYTIASVRRYGGTTYGVWVEKGKIRIE